MTVQHDAPSRFAGKAILITGATGGLGRQIALDFAQEGGRLLLADREAQPLEDLATELSGAGADVAVSVGDITHEATAKAMVAAAVDRFGGLDIAVNNAGIASRLARLTQMPAQEAEQILSVNVLGVIHAMRHELLAMQDAFARTGRRGAIVNMASVAGVLGAPHLAVYGASKHAVVGLTRSAALEYARHGVRVNAVCPSFVRTPMLDDIAGDPGQDHEGLAQGIPMRRLADPAEVSVAVRFAADPQNGFMTGQAIAIDGGLSAM